MKDLFKKGYWGQLEENETKVSSKQSCQNSRFRKTFSNRATTN